MTHPSFQPPFKSTALAILFGVLLGPVGLLYGSFYLACPLIILGYLLVANKLLPSIVVLWLLSTAFNAFFIERYNKKLLSSLASKTQESTSA